MHAVRPQRAAVDETRITLKQGGTGPNPLPGIVRRIDSARRYEYQAVSDSIPQPPQNVQCSRP
jgi:hypothetical protein